MEGCNFPETARGHYGLCFYIKSSLTERNLPANSPARSISSKQIEARTEMDDVKEMIKFTYIAHHDYLLCDNEVICVVDHTPCNTVF